MGIGKYTESHVVYTSRQKWPSHFPRSAVHKGGLCGLTATTGNYVSNGLNASHPLSKHPRHPTTHPLFNASPLSSVLVDTPARVEDTRLPSALLCRGAAPPRWRPPLAAHPLLTPPVSWRAAPTNLLHSRALFTWPCSGSPPARVASSIVSGDATSVCRTLADVTPLSIGRGPPQHGGLKK